MFYLSLVMGALVGYLTDAWLARGGVTDPLRLIISVVVGVVVLLLSYVGHLPTF